MNAYSKDLRLKVLAAVEHGVSRREISDLLGISVATISRYIKLKVSGMGIAPKPSAGRKAKILVSSAYKRALREQFDENDTATLQEHCEMFEKEWGDFGLRGDDESCGAKAGVDFQKRLLGASERDEQGGVLLGST